MFLIVQQNPADAAVFWVILSFTVIIVVWAFISNINDEDKRREEEKKWRVQRKIEEEREDIRRKKEASEIKSSSIWKADVKMSNMLEMLSEEIFICDKCKSNRFRFWNFTKTFLEVRCLGCKKNHGYQLESLENINGIFNIYKKYRELDNKSYNEYLPAIINIYDNSLPSRSNYELYRQIFIEGRRSLADKKVTSTEKRSRRISQDVRDKVWRRDEGKCVECGSNKDLEFDHIIPFSEGGANTYRNIQLLCEQCNRKKSAKIG